MSTDTLTDNELIAEFMEVPKLEDYKGIMYDIQKTGKQIYSIRANELAYHRSWEWLMPVVEKIERIDGVRVVIKKSRCRILLNKKVFSCHTIFKINSMYRVVVEFIKWYNQQPK